MPPNWGGYLIAPEVVEFWQGRENRVHNRIRVLDRSRAAGDHAQQPHRAAAALGAAALRRHHTPADTGLPAAVAGRHRHRHRRQPDDLRGAGAAVRAHPELRLRRAVRVVRAGAAGRVRAVGRRVGRRDGPAAAADHHVVRAGPGVGAVVAAGRAGAEQRLGGAVPAVGAAGVLRDQLADAGRGDSADAARRSAARGQLAEHDGHAVRRHRRAAAGRGDAALGRPVHAVPDRRDHLHRADLGDVPADADAAGRRWAGRRPVRVRARCWTASATWRATRWC